MTEVKDRIRELIDHSGLSNKDFAEKIDINPAIISHILSGRNNPSLHVIQQIINIYTNVNSDYLLTGRGQLFAESLKPGNQETEAETTTTYKQDDAVRKVAPPGSTPLPKRKVEDYQTMAGQDSVSKSTGDEGDKASQLTNVYTNVNQDQKKIERVIIFYSDKSMEEYRP